MNDFFITTFQYNNQCNKDVISLIETNPNAYSERVQTLTSHTLNAQNIWNHRILGKMPTQQVWQLFEISELQEINTQNNLQSEQIVTKGNFNTIIPYTDSKGESFRNTIKQILFHIVNHSTYHRGQIISELKSKGVTPISTDYIFYKRD